VEGSCEHGIEPSGSIKCWEVLEWLVAPQEGLSSVSKYFVLYLACSKWLELTNLENVSVILIYFWWRHIDEL
jgi:hypothetical protein